MPDSTLSLDVNNRNNCVVIMINNDNIVEGTEMFEVQFNETDENQILITGSNSIPVYIEDDESKLSLSLHTIIGFSIFKCSEHHFLSLL